MKLFFVASLVTLFSLSSAGNDGLRGNSLGAEGEFEVEPRNLASVCDTKGHLCGARATCNATASVTSLVCECDDGYFNNGTKGRVDCQDIDECVLGACHPNARCVDMDPPAKFKCTCMPGFTGDGIGANGCSVSASTGTTSPAPTTASPVGTGTPAPTPAPTLETVSFTQNFCPSTTSETELLRQSFEGETFIDGLWSNGKISEFQGSSNYPGFSTFLGPFQRADAFPYREFSFDPTSINFVTVSWYTYELGNWDGNGVGGTDSIKLMVGGDMSDVVVISHLKGNFSDPSDSGFSTGGTITWSLVPTDEEDSPQGYLPGFTDQRHLCSVIIPEAFFKKGGKITLTLGWNLVSDADGTDEAIGFDDIKVATCTDLVPSMVPSTMPSISPSVAPSMAPSMAPSEPPSKSPV